MVSIKLVSMYPEAQSTHLHLETIKQFLTNFNNKTKQK